MVYMDVQGEKQPAITPGQARNIIAAHPIQNRQGEKNAVATVCMSEQEYAVMDPDGDLIYIEDSWEDIRQWGSLDEAQEIRDKNFGSKIVTRFISPTLHYEDDEIPGQ